MSQALQRAIELQQHGKLEKAGDAYRAILADEPHHFEATHQLGLVRFQQGLHAEALKHLSEAVSLKPSDIGVLTNFGVILQSLGQANDALASYDKALALNPNLAEIHYNRGNALRELKRPADALASFDQAIAIKPRFAEAHNNRGTALRELNRPEEALASCERAVAINPSLAPAHIMRGELLDSLDRPEKALASYNRAIAVDPNVADAYIMRGDVLRKLDRPQDALASYGKALAVHPDHALAHDRRGLVLVELGRVAEARSAHEQAVALAPRTAGFHYNLTAAAQLAPGDPAFKAMKRLSHDIATLPWEEQTALHFALAKTFADNADYKNAFRHLLDGNAVKRKHIEYGEAATLAANDALRTTFTSTLMAAHRGAGDPSAVPVFVVGMPRSGTTLVEQILSSHPKVFGAGEIKEFFHAAVEVGGANLAALDLSGQNSEMSRDQLRRIGASYVQRITRNARGAARIVNKMPDNFRLLGLIHLALPNARVIHVRRDPLDTCVSCFSRLFVGANVPYTYDLAELGRYYRSYDEVMAHWRGVLPPDVMLEVNYEDVVADIEGQAKRMITHCGLQWDAGCLNPHLTQRPVRTASAVQVRRPLYKNSVGNWRNYEPFLGVLLSALWPAMSQNVRETTSRGDSGGHLDKLGNVFRAATLRIASFLD